MLSKLTCTPSSEKLVLQEDDPILLSAYSLIITQDPMRFFSSYLVMCVEDHSIAAMLPQLNYQAFTEFRRSRQVPYSEGCLLLSERALRSVPCLYLCIQSDMQRSYAFPVETLRGWIAFTC